MPFIQRRNSFAILFSFVLVILFAHSVTAQETVSFTVSNGAEIRCAADSTVEIIISPNLSDTYTEIGLSWGDGTVETILPGESLTRIHTFSTYEFLEECSYSCVVNPLINGFCFNISIIAEYDNITDENASKLITYKIPPRVMFLPDNSTICEGEEICFSNATCPNNDDDMVYTWDFGNGETSSSADTCIVYPTAGQYSVTLTATNTCGSDTQVQLITVIGLPTAEVDFGSPGVDTIACTPYTVNFTNNSVNGTTYQWQIFQDGSIVLDSTAFTTTPLEYTFTEAGVYVVSMTTRSLCGELIWEQTFIINESPTIILEEQAPACESLLYTPDVSYGGGSIDTYTWTFQGGTPATSSDEFPTDILFDMPGMHLVTLEVESLCGIETASILVDIQSPSVINIDPINAPVCNSQDSILLVATPPGGVWTGAGIVQDSFFVSSIAGEGMHQLTYTFGTGVCESSDSINVQVLPLQAVDAGENLAICIEDGVQILQGFSPADGAWTGTGIISNMPPSFDPLLAGVAEHELTYTFVDTDGCLSFDIIMATVEAMPVFQVPDTITVCNIGGDINLSELANIMPSPAGGTEVWGGPGIVDNATGLFNAGLAGGVGTYDIVYAYTTATAATCEVSDLLVVNVIAPSEAIAQPDESVCITESSYLLTATPDGGQWMGPGIVDPSTGEIDLDLAGGGQHDYTYTIFAGTSCEMSDIVIIDVIDFAGVDAGPDVSICESESSIQLMGSDNNTGMWSGLFSIGTDGFVDLMVLDTGTYQFVYTLSSNAVANCATADTMELMLVALPEVAFSVDSACVGVAAQFVNETIGATTYSWDFGGAMSILENPTFTFNTFGDFPVTLTAFTENNICESTLIQTVHISQPPELVTFAPVYQDSCAVLDVTLENGSIGENLAFVWYQGDDIISQEDGPINLSLETGRADTTYYFRLEVANGCGGEAAIDSVHVAPLPVSHFGTDQNNYCSGEEVDIINVSYGNPITYFWDFGDPTIPTSNDSIPPTIFYLSDSTAIRTISLITTNECGEDTLSYDITIHPTEVVAFFNIPDSTVCVGDSICFTNFSTFNSDLVYDFGDGNTTTDPNPCHVYQEAGTYVVELTASACGFDNTLRTIVVLPGPDLNFYIPPIVCVDEEVVVLDSSQNVSSYVWSFEDSIVSTLSTPTITFDTIGNFELTLFAESSNGCMRSLSSPIEIVGLPQSQFTSTDSICSGSPVIFTNESINANSCFWDFGDGNYSSDCNESHVYAVGDTSYIATLVVTNAAGCMDTSFHLVYIRAVPNPDFEFDDNLCSPAVIPFTNLTQNGDSYQWTLSNGTSSSETNPSFAFDTPGTVSVLLESTNDGICTESITKEVTVHQVPTASFTTSVPSVCAGDELDLSNESLGGITDQQWTFGAPDGIVSFLESPSFTFDNDSIYSIELIVNTAFCSDTMVQSFEVFEAIDITFTADDLICFEEPTGHINVSPVGGTMPFQYAWSNGAVSEDISELSAGVYELNIVDNNACELQTSFEITQPTQITTDIIDATPVSCFGGSDGLLTVVAEGGMPDYLYNWNTGTSGATLSNIVAGDYQLTVTDVNGCDVSFPFAIEQNEPIEIVDIVTNVSCFGYGDGEILIDSIIGGSPIFNLTLTGPVNYQSVNRRFGELLPGNYQLSLVDAEGCTENYTYEINQPDSIFVNILQGDTAILLGDYVDLTSDFNAEEPVFSWNPTTGLDCGDCYHPEAQPSRDVTYQITMTDKNNCVVHDTVAIKIDQFKDVFVPDAFTPNGDGHNDVFRVRSNARSIYQIREFTVLDRWGAILFQAENYELDAVVGEWRGETRDGEPVNAGVYTWYAVVEFIDGKSTTKKGDVTLLR